MPTMTQSSPDRIDLCVRTRFDTETAAPNIGRIRGYAAMFDVDSEPLGYQGVIEQIAPGAFRKTIQEADVRALWNHDPSVVLGRTKSGTLTLSEDQHGLIYEADLDLDNPMVRGVFRMIQRGDVDQSSFGFEVVKDLWEFPDPEVANDPLRRRLLEVRLFDVSPVTFPAYPQTSVGTERFLRALAAQLDRTVDDLKALEPAEIRSLNPNQIPPETPEPAPSTPLLSEARRALARYQYRSRR